MHSQTRSNNQICIAITTRSNKPLESNMGSKTPFFGKIKECKRKDEKKVNKRNIILGKLESVCGTEDEGKLTEGTGELVEKVVTPHKPSMRVITIP